MLKGYIRTDGKIPRKGESPHRPRPEKPATGDFAGVLDNGFIQIDLDNTAEADRLFAIIQAEGIDCNVIKTRRGMHFYFRNTGVERKMQAAMTPLQLTADVNTGENDALVYIKVDGAFREWRKETAAPGLLPCWLRPFKGKKSVDFMNLGEGDGRNETLYTYILTLQRAGFSKEDCRTCLTIINKYLLLEPLSEKELETIMRDEAFVSSCFFRGREVSTSRIWRLSAT